MDQGGKPAGRQVRKPEGQQAAEPEFPSATRRTVIRHHWELDTHKLAVEAVMQVFELSKSWPAEERFSLTDQVRRSSRSVAAQIAEGWGKRKHEASFINKLNDAEGDAAEAQDWIMFAVRCGYLDRENGRKIHQECDHLPGKLTKMGNHPTPWLLNRKSPGNEH